MRRNVLLVCLLLLSGLATSTYGSETLAPTESGVVPGPSGSVAAISDGAGNESTGNSPQVLGKRVSICHFDADLGEWELLSVAGTGARAHLKNHDDAANPPGATAISQTKLNSACAEATPSVIRSPLFMIAAMDERSASGPSAPSRPSRAAS